MTHASDESPLDWRGPDISRRYRQLPVDSVPTDLDRLILEHARTAVAASAPPRHTWIRWGLPLGLVGSALLAATLVLDGAHRPQEQSIAQSRISSAAMPERAEVPMTSTTRLPAAAASPISDAPAARSRPAAPAIAPRRTENAVASLPISAPMPVSNPRQPAAALVAEAMPEPAIAAAALNEPPSPAPPPSVAPAQPLEQSAGSDTTQAPLQTEPQSAFEEFDALRLSTSSPAKLAAAEERLEDIRYMRQTGRNRRADYEWRKFLEDFPNYPVAADDIARPRAK